MPQADEGVKRYRQVFLSGEELEYGLTYRPDRPRPPGHWLPVPSEPIAVLKAEPDTLEQRLGVTFQNSIDQLDYLRLVVIDLVSGIRVALIRHRGAPSGTSVYILPQQLIDDDTLRRNLYAAIDQIQDGALQQIMDDLRLVPSDFSWRRPNVTGTSSDI